MHLCCASALHRATRGLHLSVGALRQAPYFIRHEVPMTIRQLSFQNFYSGGVLTDDVDVRAAGGHVIDAYYGSSLHIDGCTFKDVVSNSAPVIHQVSLHVQRRRWRGRGGGVCGGGRAR